MYSKVKVLGHPLHAMLVGFPVAFFTGTLAAFIVYAASTEPFWYQLGWVINWAGVAMAAVAALPGFIDWASGIPSRTAAKKTGLIHMGLNTTVLVLFLINALIATGHHNDAVPPAATAVVLSAIGVLLMLPAGFLGWSLVQDHHVGVQLSPEQERLEPVAELTTPERRRPSSPVASH